MKNVLTATFLTCICITGSAQINHGYPIDPVPFTSVKVTDNFWGQRLQAMGPLVEKYFRMAMTAELGNFGGILQRPIAVVCLIVAILFLVLPLFSKKLRDRKNALNI